MLTNKNLNINQIFDSGGKYAHWRIVSILIVGIMIGSALFTANFVYNNIYITLSNANTIIALSSSLGIDAVDVKNYNLAEEKREEKAENFTWPENLRNIFNYEVAPSTTKH
jgi:hypothetical protein